MLMALTSIGQAAIGGAAEALLESAEGDTAPSAQQSAQHMKAVNQIVSQLGGVVQEVRV